jgi:hypothetical protein
LTWSHYEVSFLLLLLKLLSTD